MTTRYAHLSPDVRRDAVKLLDVRQTVRLTGTTSRGVLLQIAHTRNKEQRRSRSPLFF
jgi:hypothetical protein